MLNVRIAILYQIMILIKRFCYGSHILKTGKDFRQKILRYMKKIKDRIKNEFLDDMPSNFDSVFEEFIQNTFVHKSELCAQIRASSLAGGMPVW